MAKEIELTRGQVAIVDDADFEELNIWKWHYSHPGKGNGTQGYARRARPGGRKARKEKGAWIYMHRQICGYDQVDHANGNKLDNRRENLRRADKSRNGANRRKFQRKTKPTSNYKGVYWRKSSKAWVAQIGVKGVRKHLGFFSDEIEAARHYDMAAIIYFKEFASLNFPRSDYGLKDVA
jgi:hypothetical protein